MIKLVDLFKESFPHTIEKRVVHFKAHLKPGKIILKNWPHSHQDELHMYIDDKVRNNTPDYSNISDAHLTIRTVKIGELAHDQHLGEIVDFAMDKALLDPGVVTLDSEWRFLKPDEIKTLKIFLQKPLSTPNIAANTNEEDLTQTCQEVLEKYTKHRIIL